MFRSAVARSAAAAASRRALSNVARAALVRRTATPAITRISVSSTPFKAAAPTAVRWYSAGGSLNKEEVEGRIISLLQGFDKVNDASNIKPNSHFANDLGLDSLDTVEVVMAIEEEFSIEIPDKDSEAIHSVDQAVEYILHQPDAH